MVVTAKQYNELKSNFFSIHDYDYSVDTSSMNEYGEYSKIYTFMDGAQWYESMRPVYETVDVEVHKVKTKVEVKLFETEFWNSSVAETNAYYERF